mgnify:FL=1
MRWRQVYDPETDTSQFVPIDEEARRHEGINIIRDNFDPFRSIVDGSVITNHRELEEHNRRNNVVSASEFSPEFIASKTAERERILNGERTAQETRAVKMELYERMTRAEQGLNYK